MRSMKFNRRKLALNFLIASCLIFSMAGNALAADEDIPTIGNISGSTTTEDVTENLGIFAEMGEFILEYAVHIAIFVMVLAVVLLSVRGSWARSNNKVDDATDVQKNQKGLIVDGILTMAALLFIFYILAPFVKSFIS